MISVASSMYRRVTSSHSTGSDPLTCGKRAGHASAMKGATPATRVSCVHHPAGTSALRHLVIAF